MEDIKKVLPIGKISENLLKIIDLPVTVSRDILIGPTNIEHMKNTHPVDYEKYACKIIEILKYPDWVIPNQKDLSLQYIKQIDAYVLVAIRMSQGNIWYVRSIYTMSEAKIERFTNKGLFEKFKIK